MNAHDQRLVTSARVISGALLAALCATSIATHAASLYWGKTPVHTSSLKQCISFARDSMHHLSYQHIRVSQDEVAGDRPGVYAAVTCIGTSPATAVVMAVGDNGGTVSEARNALSKNMAGIIRFDDQ